MHLLRALGFAINYSKVEGPVKRLVFLGIVLDSISMTLELPKSKLEQFHHDLTQFRSRVKVSKKQLQSIAGKLNWASQVIYGGRFHLRRIINRMNSLRSPWHRSRVTQDIKADIDWWLTFMSTFNGSTPMVDSRPTAPVVVDACNVAAGASYLGDWLYTKWDAEFATNSHINTKEICALEPAAARWAHLWSNKTIYVYTDNMVAVSAFNKGWCRDSVAMDSLRRVFWLSATYNFRLKAIYYPGQYNCVADAISRLHEPAGWPRLTALLPHVVPWAPNNVTHMCVFSPQAQPINGRMNWKERCNITGQPRLHPQRQKPIIRIDGRICSSVKLCNSPPSQRPQRHFANMRLSWPEL